MAKPKSKRTIPSVSIELPLAVDGGDMAAAASALDEAALALNLAGRRLALSRIFAAFEAAADLPGAQGKLSLSWSFKEGAGRHGEDLHRMAWLVDGEAPGGEALASLSDSARHLGSLMSNHARFEAESAAQAREEAGLGPWAIDAPEQAAAWLLDPGEQAAWLADFERRKIAEASRAPAPQSARKPGL